jgi:hypothetical protein
VASVIADFIPFQTKKQVFFSTFMHGKFYKLLSTVPLHHEAYSFSKQNQIYICSNYITRRQKSMEYYEGITSYLLLRTNLLISKFMIMIMNLFISLYTVRGSLYAWLLQTQCSNIHRINYSI